MIDDRGILNQLLGLGSNWQIDNVVTDKKEQTVEIYLSYVVKVGSNGDALEKIYDYTKSRRIRHLNIFEYCVYLNFRAPRIKDKDGNVRVVDIGFADDRVSYSKGFEQLVINTLELSKNQSGTADYLKTSFDIVHQIMERSVIRGLKRRDLTGVNDLGIDEKSIKNGHTYLTILTNKETQTIIDIIQGRKTDDVEELIMSSLNTQQREGIKDVSMDMWEAYRLGVENTLPNADISHDNFHIKKYLNKGVDETRKEEVKKHQELKNSKYVMLKNKENMSEKQRDKFDSINAINLKTSQAWRIKENFKQLYFMTNYEQCRTFFTNWYEDIIESEIKPMLKVADTLLNHITGVINAALKGKSNSISENINSKIQIIKATSRGFKTFEGYRNSLLFFLGGLDVSPL